MTDYAEDMQMGVIRTPDEKRFIFGKPDWASEHVAPAAGLNVEFDISGPTARKIVIVEPGKG